jgi:hypothetical protein
MRRTLAVAAQDTRRFSDLRVVLSPTLVDVVSSSSSIIGGSLRMDLRGAWSFQAEQTPHEQGQCSVPIREPAHED